MLASEPVVLVKDLQTRIGGVSIHRGVSLPLAKGMVHGLVGGSGSGKSVLMRTILGLLRPVGGSVRVFGTDVWNCPDSELSEIRSRVGVLFQNGALFSALTVGENVAVPLMERGISSEQTLDELVRLRLELSGLEAKHRHKRPAELSGGMVKRAALARALALEPELLFLDEPTSGLDPITARAFDELIQTLVKNLGITVFMITHDLDSIWGIVDNLVVLGDGKLLAQGPVEKVAQVDHPWIRSYFAARADRKEQV